MGLMDVNGNLLATEKAKTLCTITFIYTTKGVIDTKKPKKETVFAWIEEGCTNTDCVELFRPTTVKREHCIIQEIIVLPIPTVTHE